MTDDTGAMRDEWDELDERLEEEPPRSWRPGYKAPKGDARAAFPVDGNKIRGTFVREDWNSTEEYGDKRVLILAEHPTGELRSVWCLHQTLEQDAARANLQPGDRVAIRYDGLVKSPKKGGQPYHAYKIVVQRAGVPAAAVGAGEPDAGAGDDDAGE